MFTLTDSRTANLSLFDFPAPAGQVVGEAFDNALETNPIPMALLWRELSQAKERGPLLPPDQAQAETQRAGVTVGIPKEGITKDALDILIERRRDDIARGTLFARREGAGATAGMFAAGFAGALMDPLNVAAGFIPFYGQVRYAGMLAKAATPFARAGVRLGVGAIEGAGGAALVEAPTVALRQQLQDDYSLYDSLANIAFGTFANAGIRGVTGAARDAYLGVAKARQLDTLRAIDPEIFKEMGRRAATAQERGFWSDLETGFQRGEGLAPEAIAEFEARRFGPEFAQQMADFAAERAVYGQLADVAIERMTERNRQKALAEGLPPDEALTAAVRATAEARRAEGPGGLLSQADIGKIRISEMALDDARKAILEGAGLVEVPGRPVPANPREILLAISDSTHAQALKTAVAQAIEGRRIDVDPVLRQDPAFGNARMSPDEVRARAKANMAPEARVGTNMEASRRVDAELKTSEVPKAPVVAAAEGFGARVKAKAQGEAPKEAPKAQMPKSEDLILAEAQLAADRARIEMEVREGGGEFKTTPGEDLLKGDKYDAAYRALAACAGGKGL